MNKILIIDDEIDIIDILKYNLVKEGFEVHFALNGTEGMKIANAVLPDLILLDVMMPGLDGIEVCHSIRSNKKFEHTLICFLTARGEDFSQIAGLDAGADDYIAKPIKPRLLISRINALLRRKNNSVSLALQGDKQTKEDGSTEGLVIDREKYLVFKNQEPIHLPKKEFELLSLLASRPGIVFEREVILEKVWGTDIIVGDRTIDVHVRKLREKIGDDYIKTVKGIGYKFIPHTRKS